MMILCFLTQLKKRKKKNCPDVVRDCRLEAKEREDDALDPIVGISSDKTDTGRDLCTEMNKRLLSLSLSTEQTTGRQTEEREKSVKIFKDI